MKDGLGHHGSNDDEALKACDRKARAVRDQISNPAWDAIYETAELLGGPYLIGAKNFGDACSPERSRLIRDILAMPAYDKAARAKVWRETI